MKLGFKFSKGVGALLVLLSFSLAACSFNIPGSGSDSDSAYDFITKAGRGTPLTIVSGSENKVLEPMIENYAKASGNKIALDYLGSLDIMNLIRDGSHEYNAVWPASTMWLSMGDEKHVLKHTESTSNTPVIFGIKKSLADKLGFTNRDDVTMDEIGAAIDSGKLKFAMTSATQSNSGASSYLAFLTAFANNPNGLSQEDLSKPELATKITSLLSGVNRSSGSSDWLVDLFLSGNYDAMVNYEQLIIQTNLELEKQNKEILYAVYPKDGLAISDSPLAYVDTGNSEEDREKIFLDFQKYVLGDEGQDQIEKTGKRNAFNTISDTNKNVFREDWGIQPNKILSPIKFPSADVINEALNLYQTSFKKPSYTVYVLDYSGSMEGEGNQEMLEALSQIWNQAQAKSNFLQNTDKDVSVFLPFAAEVGKPQLVTGWETMKLLKEAETYPVHGGTAMYEALTVALQQFSKVDNLDEYTPAIVVLTDGAANGTMTFTGFQGRYQKLGLDIPIFSIMFGDASSEQLDQLAKLTKARVFDGTKNLNNAFKTVRGYN